MKEDITKLLQVLGQDATFTTFTLRVFPNFDLYTVDPTTNGFGGMAVIEMSHAFLAETAECKTKGLTENLPFTITDGNYLYHFETIKENPDMTGMSEILTAYREKTNV